MPRRSRKTSSSHAPVVRRKPSLDFSVTGLVFCSMMMFMGLAAINSQANLLFGVFGLMIGVLFVAGFVSRSVLRKLKVERDFPEHLTVGQRGVITYRFTNEKRFWPSLSVCLGELDGNEAFTQQIYCYMLHAAGGQTAVVPTDVSPRRRGLHTFDRFQLSTSFPFGFIKRAVERRVTDTVLVFPPAAKVDQKVLTLCRAAEKTGAMMRPRRGGVDEIYGVKEYRPGDNPRWIHWRRSARTGQLVVREMTQVSPPRLLLLVDTYVENRSRAAHAAVERSIARAGALATYALDQGLMVGLLCWNDGWQVVAANRGKRQRRDILAALSRLPLNTDHPTPTLIDSSYDVLESGTTPVLFTPRDIAVGLGEHMRSGMLVISDKQEQASRWFVFDPEIDFGHVMPPEQEPSESDGSRQKAKGERQKEKT
jgi:uncharacterized protein (DUF58 family)